MQVKIRKALSSDIDIINDIYNRIHTEQENGRVYIGWIRGIYPTRTTAEKALLRDDLFVEESDGKIVGAAIINQTQLDTYRESDWQYVLPDEQVMVLHTLVIDPYSNGKGFGKRFVEYYERYAAEHGCSALRIDTNELNTNARSFYKKLGYHEVGILPCTFNGIPDIGLVLLEKKLN